MSFFKPKPFKDPELEEVLKRMPRVGQRQYSADDQMRYLVQAGNMLGLYDAVDILNAILNRKK
jgi:hypothetical protein